MSTPSFFDQNLESPDQLRIRLPAAIRLENPSEPGLLATCAADSWDKGP